MIIARKNKPLGQAGKAWGPFAFIREACRRDEGLIQHELCHVVQFWRAPWTHQLRYTFSRSYRLACEVEAFRVQIAYGADPAAMAALLADDTRYRLGITFDEALALLTTEPKP